MSKKSPVKIWALIGALFVFLSIAFNNCGETPYLKEKAKERQEYLDSLREEGY